MWESEIFTLENQIPEIRTIQSEARGLFYAIDNDRMGIVISGRQGKTGLTIPQAKAVCRELAGILEEMDYSI